MRFRTTDFSKQAKAVPTETNQQGRPGNQYRTNSHEEFKMSKLVSNLIFALAVIIMTAASGSFADSDIDLAKENAELKKRVETLEKEMQMLKQMVLQNTKAQTAQTESAAQPPTSAQPQFTAEQIEKLQALVASDSFGKSSVWTKDLDIQLYGYIKLDASYDDSRTSTGNFVKWVDSEATGGNDNEFNMTARQTRLGMNITGPEDGGLKTSGKVEFDLYGGTAENKPEPMLRHAYMKLDWPEKRFNIIAGQTWDVISPLNPYTLNYSVGWWAGNIGYRRPQLRLTKEFAVAKDTNLKLEGALARAIGDDDLTTNSGEDAGFPVLQGRASIKTSLCGYKPATIGVSGHWGEEEYGAKDTETWSVNLDYSQPVNEWLTIEGELFAGENLDAYLGGIGQGVNTSASNRAIGSRGGWIAAALGPWDKWRFNTGITVDDVDEDDVNTGDRTLNRSIFSNVIYSINKNTEAGLELSHWRTERKNTKDADNLRVQTSLIYKF